MDWFPPGKTIPPPAQMERLENELNDLKEAMESETNNESPRYLGLCKRFTNLQTAYVAAKKQIEDYYDAYNHRKSGPSAWKRFLELDAAYDGEEQAVLDAVRNAQ